MTEPDTHASIDDLDQRLEALDRKLGDELARLRRVKQAEPSDLTSGSQSTGEAA